MLSLSSVFLGVDELLLVDEDAIKELSFVLATNSADLADLGAAEGSAGVVNAFEDQFVLEVSSELDDDAREHLDFLVLLATQEVLDRDRRSVLGDDNVDGEVSVHQPHSVAEALQKSIIINLTSGENQADDPKLVAETVRKECLLTSVTPTIMLLMMPLREPAHAASPALPNHLRILM